MNSKLLYFSIGFDIKRLNRTVLQHECREFHCRVILDVYKYARVLCCSSGGRLLVSDKYTSMGCERIF